MLKFKFCKEIFEDYNVPAEVKVVGKLQGAISMSKVGRTLVICRQNSKVFLHHLFNIRMNPKTTKKNELSQALRQAGKIPYHKTKAVELRVDLVKHLKFLQK